MTKKLLEKGKSNVQKQESYKMQIKDPQKFTNVHSIGHPYFLVLHLSSTKKCIHLIKWILK